MLTIRKSADRGHANHGWLDSYHTFSFADYYDPNHMGFRALRVINEDRVAPKEGFGTHPHRDMEILTYVMQGKLEHRDSMGNGRVIKPGEVQGMSAGTGITHSEFNATDNEQVHLLQIWITPHTKSIKPSYGEWLPDGHEKNGWALVASENGAGGSIRIHQDAKLFVAVAKEGSELPVHINPARYGWIQIASGEAVLDGQVLHAGDGASFGGEDASMLSVTKPSEILLFDLA
jgi:redox-sensitive bicupin YhaK (pirin superfamily)